MFYYVQEVGSSIINLGQVYGPVLCHLKSMLVDESLS